MTTLAALLGQYSLLRCKLTVDLTAFLWWYTRALTSISPLYDRVQVPRIESSVYCAADDHGLRHRDCPGVRNRAVRAAPRRISFRGICAEFSVMLRLPEEHYASLTPSCYGNEVLTRSVN